MKLLLFLSLLPAAPLGKEFFRAAVFEHRPRLFGSRDYLETVLTNLWFYEKAADVASGQGADIIVFNEYGLRGGSKSREELMKGQERVPDPARVKINPCLKSSDGKVILTSLSCIAKNNNMYVVANMIDIKPCDGTCDAFEVKCPQNCPEDNYLMYNTDVAFDREGNLIARYHKQHPYFENLNIPEEQEYVTFQTEFGVFGLIVCFDSVFVESTILSRQHGIDTLLFPTFWFDDIVPLNAVEWQQSYAIANHVNFLAANTQMPGNASLGSGIYSKDLGALAYTYEPDGESKLVVSNVPLRTADLKEFRANATVTVIDEDGIHQKRETGDAFPFDGYLEVAGPEKDHYLDYRYFKHQMENYTLVKLDKSRDKIKACNNGFCCYLNYSAGDMKEYYYLGAKSGMNNARGFYHWFEESCILLRCDPVKGKACVSTPSRSETVFTSLKMEAAFTADFVYPTVSKTKHRLAPKNEWELERKGKKVSLKFQSDAEVPLLKAAMLGRCYDRDPPYEPFFKF